MSILTVLCFEYLKAVEERSLMDEAVIMKNDTNVPEQCGAVRKNDFRLRA